MQNSQKRLCVRNHYSWKKLQVVPLLLSTRPTFIAMLFEKTLV